MAVFFFGELISEFCAEFFRLLILNAVFFVRLAFRLLLKAWKGLCRLLEYIFFTQVS